MSKIMFTTVTLCFPGNLLCVFAVNGIAMSVFKTDTAPMR